MMRIVCVALLVASACVKPMGPPDGGSGDGGPFINDSLLQSLAVSVGELTPAFSPLNTVYVVSPPRGVGTVTVTATPRDTIATLQLNGATLTQSKPSPAVDVTEALTRLEVRVKNGDTETSYVVFVVPPSSHYVKPQNTSANLGFGTSVALQGNTLAVGAVGANQGQGAVYVFTRTDFRWSAAGIITAAHGDPGDWFGASVALSGNSLAVGAPFEGSDATGAYGDELNNRATHAGAVYVFETDGTAWSQQAYLKAHQTHADDLFGSRVTLDGDTLAIGAPGASSNAGGVTVYTRTGSTWSYFADVTANRSAAGDAFGSSLALSGDSLVVGAPGERSAATGVGGNDADTSAPGAGSAYVFLRQSASWAQQGYLKASNSRSNAGFGHSVAIDGDTVAVGAWGESSKATDVNGDATDVSLPGAGAAYLFTRSLGVWAADAYVKAHVPRAGAQFGVTLALVKDTLVVGANHDDSAGHDVGASTSGVSTDSGAVSLYRREPLGWRHVAQIKAAHPDPHDTFGTAVALTADTLAVGAPMEASSTTGVDGASPDNAAPGAGAVELYGH